MNIEDSMKKLTPGDTGTRSADLVKENIAKLKALFPELVTEGAQDGAVNLDVLKGLVGDNTVTDVEERYGLTWHGKRRARQLALMPSTGTLRPNPKEGVSWETTKNLMIEGDNLEVLKLFQKSYAGKVNVIYIDPPYNTGSDFVYPDDFHDSIKNYLRITGQVDPEGQKISTNTDSSGRFHTDWLNMMYPRLKLAHSLLRQDGVMFVSIDDSEVDNLRIACNELFGEENFIAQLVWEKGRKNDAKLFSAGHEYLVVYAKSKGYLTEQKVRWREAKPGAAEIQAEYLRLKAIHGIKADLIQRDLRKFYSDLPKDHPSKKLSRYSNVDDRGVWRDDNMSWPGGGGPAYTVLHPTTQKPCKVPEGGWRYSTAEKMQHMIATGRVLFRKDHTEPPIRKTYLVRSEDEADLDELEDGNGEDVGIQVAGTYFYRSALQASNLMLEMFGAKVFDNPKDHEVLARWISYVSNSTKDDIVLDFFAGSGTTGHAVMAQNAADGGSRRFILIQLPEPLNPEKKEQKIAAGYCDKLKKPRNIAELTKERLRRAAKRVKEEHPEFSGDLGFRVFKLDSTNIQEWEPKRDNLETSILTAVDHLKAGRSPEDVVYEILLKLGLDLCVPIEKHSIAGKDVYAIGGGVLMASLPEKIAANEVEKLALGIVEWQKKLAPAVETTCVFRDSAFTDDVAKTNLAAILNQHGIANVRSL
jgi:adenine-specific DNA-methyltransferase